MVLSKSLQDALKAALRSGCSFDRIAKDTGVPSGTIARFASGDGITLETAAKIAAFFSVRLTKPTRGLKPPKA